MLVDQGSNSAHSLSWFPWCGYRVEIEIFLFRNTKQHGVGSEDQWVSILEKYYPPFPFFMPILNQFVLVKKGMDISVSMRFSVD